MNSSILSKKYIRAKVDARTEAVFMKGNAISNIYFGDVDILRNNFPCRTRVTAFENSEKGGRKPAPEQKLSFISEGTGRKGMREGPGKYP